MGWHTPEECVCVQCGKLGAIDCFRKKFKKKKIGEIFSLLECRQLSKQSRCQEREDRQDGGGKCAARLSTLGQTSRQHRMLQSPLL